MPGSPNWASFLKDSKGSYFKPVEAKKVFKTILKGNKNYDVSSEIEFQAVDVRLDMSAVLKKLYTQELEKKKMIAAADDKEEQQYGGNAGKSEHKKKSHHGKIAKEIHKLEHEIKHAKRHIHKEEHKKWTP